MQENEGFSIVKAASAHVSAIASIARSRSLDAIPDVEEASRSGFLVSGYDEATYRDRLTKAEHFYVALRGGDVVGFILAYSDANLESDEWLNHRIKGEFGSFLVIKQVCVARHAARQGVASRLYRHVLRQWHASPVIAAIVSEPENVASIAFHREMGFEPLTELTPPDGVARKVWVRRSHREAMLHAQYQVAVDLYKHEDVTNWNKLNNFFYITAALAAAASFAFSGGNDNHRFSDQLALVVAIIGFASSLAFAEMLLWGRRYLLARKNSVARMEQYIVWHGGQRVVGRELSGPRRDGLRQSPTGMIMILLPLFVGLCWVALIIVIAVK
ncbi:GNAT family N-acetyltransferase [Actinacidiphila acididurans]|uniref:GNAT family N-acetyltransferase n=1 Tax=Actinacidiphila acididurans TaxID=2784346 RepID=UPI0027DC4156|nr:GNAT family N-acetyltransferase [Actinacidiphila acididurans]